MKKNLVFAIDCDEVLRSTLCNMVRIYNEEIGDNMKCEDVKEFDVSVSFPRIEKETGIPAHEWFFDCHSKELFFESKAIKGAKKAIDILKKYGKVVILTYQRSCENKLHTLEWLCKNKMAVDDICFLKDKNLLQCDYLIDDNVSNFIDSCTKHAVLITAPYNEKFNIENFSGGIKITDKSLCNILSKSKALTAERFDNILDFAKHIETNFKTKTYTTDEQ